MRQPFRPEFRHAGEFLLIGGWKEVSLVDVLEHSSFTLWLALCNLKCPWCSNADVARGLTARVVSVADIVEIVDHAKSFVDVLHVTGGEPTLQLNALKRLFKSVAEKVGLPVSLSTNGTMPEALRALSPFLYHVAIDIKAPLDEPRLYATVTGISERLAQKLVSRILESVKASLEVPNVELRTTLVPDVISSEDVLKAAVRLEEILKNARGRVAYVVQQFIPYEGVRGPFSGKKATQSQEVIRCAEHLASMLSVEVYYRTLEEGTRKVR